jgi:hypothetical protein
MIVFIHEVLNSLTTVDGKMRLRTGNCKKAQVGLRMIFFQMFMNKKACPKVEGAGYLHYDFYQAPNCFR